MFKLTTASAAVILAAGVAQAATIDFEEFGHGDNIDSVSAGGVTATVTVNSNGAFDQAVGFDTSLTGTADPDLEAPFTGSGGANPGTILIISEDGGPDDERAGGTVTFDFSEAVNFIGFSAFDGGLFEVTSAKGDELEVADNVVAGDNLSNRLLVPEGEFVGVQSLTFLFANSGEGASGGIDDLEFVVTDTPSPVPVPAALPLLAAGLGGLAFVGRRRRG